MVQWPLGGRDADRGRERVQRPDLVRPGGELRDRRASCGGTLDAQGRKPPDVRGHDRRPERLHPAVEDQFPHLPPSGAKRSTDGIQLCAHGGRAHVHPARALQSPGSTGTVTLRQAQTEEAMQMRIRIYWLSVALMLVIIGAVSKAVLVAQAPSSGTTSNRRVLRGDTDAAVRKAAEAAKADAALKAWTAPKTSWGDPDLLGLWMTATYTPLQRPEALGTKAFYTEEE